MISIDLNSDVGEGVGNEAQLMPYLSSCNIACGGHTGDEQTMAEVLAFAKKYSVKVGAHPSYPDRINFGREVMDISASELRASITSQIVHLKQLAMQMGVQLHHVKPHGALYNKAAIDGGTARVIIDTLLEVDEQLALYVPYNSVIAKMAVPSLKVIVEGFADRAYNEDYTLVSRKKEGAVFTQSSAVIKNVLPMVKHQTVRTIHGKEMPFKIDTLCVHGDTENAFTILKELYHILVEEGIKII